MLNVKQQKKHNNSKTSKEKDQNEKYWKLNQTWKIANKRDMH